MSDLHDLCRLTTRPITQKHYITDLKYYLSNGIPATYTLEEAANFEAGIEDDVLSSTTTPLHLICRSIPLDASDAEKDVILEMMAELFSWGAGWNLVDDEGNTPGDVLFKRGFRGSEYYNALLEMMQQGDVPMLVEETEEEKSKREAEEAQEKKIAEEAERRRQEEINDPAATQETYLKTKLEYRDGALITKDNKDGVMMDWEHDLMQAGCDTIFKSVDELAKDDDDLKEVSILNIGFGMGIIDTMIQAKNPTRHFISEAHPDVLAKLKEDGWYEKSNVTILEGRWQDTLPELLNQGIFFNGIYYDTFSEEYSDMLDLYDLIVGLLKPSGIFSSLTVLVLIDRSFMTFTKKIVEIDLNNYGMDVKYTELETPKTTTHMNMMVKTILSGRISIGLIGDVRHISILRFVLCDWWVKL
ncbi:Protein arginine N-methyltransferase 2 [Cyberlindnera fabianii]|uniref:Arginine N-methyltransferase 2 n=1 Tax=Cyberlindnera fabianii TaxID=36022 RepID=A0A1V2L0Q5_CYBFA|nr:Protein arginine N-methyltransferase 2 [Cyberlindnera fabianii]